MKLIELLEILRQFYSNCVDVEVYYRCPCCMRDSGSTIFELFSSDLKFNFMDKKVLKIFYKTNKLVIEIEY